MDVNNQGLNIPSNLQNLDVRDELLSTEVGSGSACAYSLRDLTGNNLNCVRVRREPEDTTDAIDNEKIFSAQAVASGELEDWVNGKLETTLPLDVATGSAGYSLRKIKSSYNDNAVRIRRISDGVEVEVAFDSDDKVSSSSPITDGGTELTPNPDEDLGSTSATTLGGFLTESATYFDTTGASSNTVQGLALVAGDNIGTVTFNASDGFGGDASFTFTGYSTSSSFHDNFYWNKSFSATEFLGTASSEKTVTIQAYVKRTNGNVGDSLIFREYGTSNKVTFTDLPLNEWKLVTGSIPTTNAGNNDHIQIGGTNGTIFKLSLVKYSVNLQDAFVHTWYDQAGSNDAVQSTADNQPKIAENGALLADGLTFDGSDDFLQTTSQVLTGTETGANSMYAVIKQTSGDAGYICGSASNPSGSDQVGQSLYSASSNDKIVLTNGNDATATGTLDTITRIEGSNYLVSSNYSNNNTDTLHSNSSATGYANGSSAYDFNAGDRFTIGARKDSTSSSAVLFDGSMKEIIAYDSDQTDNRFKIESNINNYYDLYTSQGNGFVETWYDQSGNGNHATQGSATNQPKIVDSGSLVTQDGKPALAFDGETNDEDFLTITKPSQLSTDMSFLTVINFIDPDGKSNNQDVFISQAGTRWWLYAQNSNSGYTIRSNNNQAQNAVVKGSQPINTQRLFTVIRNNSSDSAQMRVNGSLEHDNTSGMTLSITSDDFTLGKLGAGTGTGGRASYANVQEVIFFGSAIESDASELETEINNYYNIYS